MTNIAMKISLPFNSKMQKRDFLFGVATASFQIEGGIDSRLPCIWDTFCNTPNKIRDNSDGAIACDHYNLWQQDVDLIESLDVDAYRLSISGHALSLQKVHLTNRALISTSVC